MNVKGMIDNVAREVGENKSTLLTIGAVLGVAATAVTTIIGSFKAKELMDNHEGKIEFNTVIALGKCYIVPLVLAGGTIICIVCAHKTDAAKYAALAAVYASDSKKVDSLVKKIENKSDKEPCDTDAAKQAVVQVADGSSDELRFWDEYLGRFVKTNFRELQQATENLNNEVHGTNGGVGVLRDFYREISDVDHNADVICGDCSIGWNNEDGIIGLEYDGALDDNLKPYVIYRFNQEPHRTNESMY